jgi:hypothetical protein
MGKNSKGGSTGHMSGTTALLKLVVLFLQVQTQRELNFVD